MLDVWCEVVSISRDDFVLGLCIKIKITKKMVEIKVRDVQVLIVKLYFVGH